MKPREKILHFEWRFKGQAPYEVPHVVQDGSVLALPQLSAKDFLSLTISREDLAQLPCEGKR